MYGSLRVDINELSSGNWLFFPVVAYIFAAMSTRSSFLCSLAAVCALAGIGCAQPQNTAQNTAQRKYYHDRSNSIGSNVPRSYSDPASANNQTTSNGITNMQNDQAMQSGLAVMPSGGGGGGR